MHWLAGPTGKVPFRHAWITTCLLGSEDEREEGWKSEYATAASCMTSHGHGHATSRRLLFASQPDSRFVSVCLLFIYKCKVRKFHHVLDPRGVVLCCVVLCCSLCFSHRKPVAYPTLFEVVENLRCRYRCRCRCRFIKGLSIQASCLPLATEVSHTPPLLEEWRQFLA